MPPRRLFALDQNFPEPVLAALTSVLPAELVPIRKIDRPCRRWTTGSCCWPCDAVPVRWDGLITNDDSMLQLPREMVVLSQTRLTLVVAKGEGHNPIRAVGALLCHLPHICHHTVPDRAQIWSLRVSQKDPDEVDKYLGEIAKKKGTTIPDLVAANRVPPSDLLKTTT